MSRTVGVVLAGGIGTRAGLGMPKQLVHVGGRTILERSVAALHTHRGIDGVLVLMPAEWLAAAHDTLGTRYPKLLGIHAGGVTRNDTTQVVLDLLRSTTARVLLHDGVRPFVDQRTISDCLTALDTYAAVTAAIPSTDTVVIVDDRGVVTSMPARSGVRRVQTPQAFHVEVLRGAYRLAAADVHFTATDDCGVVLRYLPDVAVATVLGSESNVKVTHASDLALAELLASSADD